MENNPNIELMAIMTAIWAITGSSTPTDIPHAPTAEFWKSSAVSDTDIDDIITKFFSNEDEEVVLSKIREQLTPYVGKVHGSLGEMLRRAPIGGNVIFRPDVPEDELDPSVVKFAKSEYERLSKHFEGNGPSYDVILRDVGNIYYDPLQTMLMSAVKDKKKSIGTSLTTMEEYDPHLSNLHNALLGHTSYFAFVPRLELIYIPHIKQYYIYHNPSRTDMVPLYDSDGIEVDYRLFAARFTQALGTIMSELTTRYSDTGKSLIEPHPALPSNSNFTITLDTSVKSLSDINFDTVKVTQV